MAEFRGNMNGGRNGRATAEENPPFRRGSNQSQFQPESRYSRVNEEDQFVLPNREFDLQNLESSFDRLSVVDSAVLNHQFPLPDNRLRNRSPSLQNQRINGGGSGGGGGGGGGANGGYLIPPPPMDLDYQQISNHLQRLSFENYCVNGGGGGGGGAFGYNPSTSVMLNNGFLNGNSRDVPYFSSNPFLNQSSNGGFGSEINNHSRRNSYRSDPSSSSMQNLPIISLAKDRLASKELQNRILQGSRETIDMIFDNVIFYILELMMDPYGNQLLQKLMEKCNSEQINQILDMVIEHNFRFVIISNDPLGVHIMKLLMSCLHSENQIVRIMNTINIVAMQLTRSNHGKQVILECFRKFSPMQNRSLIETITGNCYLIAIDQHGCCMLQQCMSNGCEELKQRLFGEIINNALRLCANCYGNYVVQYVVDLDDRVVIGELIGALRGYFAHLSRNKYGSHVVQKFLKIKNTDTRLILNDLLQEINTVLPDQYGNYVVQTAWDVAPDDIRHTLWCYVQSHYGDLRYNQYVTKLLEKLKFI